MRPPAGGFSFYSVGLLKLLLGKLLKVLMALARFCLIRSPFNAALARSAVALRLATRCCSGDLALIISATLLSSVTSTGAESTAWNP